MAMKSNKTTLRVESLEGRALLSANPLGDFAPAPEPPAGTLRSWSITFPAHITAAEPATPQVTLKNVFVSGVQVEPTAKIVVRWEKIAVPVVAEGATSGGIVTEGQGYGIAVRGGSEGRVVNVSRTES
jgi:hypothetical protein